MLLSVLRYWQILAHALDTHDGFSPHYNPGQKLWDTSHICRQMVFTYLYSPIQLKKFYFSRLFKVFHPDNIRTYKLSALNVAALIPYRRAFVSMTISFFNIYNLVVG